MRRYATPIALVVLAALLVGALLAGTPVNGDESSAARTAGIHLTTPPVVRQASSAVPAPSLPPVVLAALLLLVLVASSNRPVAASGTHRQRAIDGALGRRGPPASA